MSSAFVGSEVLFSPRPAESLKLNKEIMILLTDNNQKVLLLSIEVNNAPVQEDNIC